jgi:hypothetical protein
VVSLGRHLAVDRAAVNGRKILNTPIMHVGCNHVADLAARRTAVTVDLTPQARIDVQDGAAQRLALDEIVGQLIERAIVIRVQPRVAFEHPDQDLPLALVIAIEREAGAFADRDAIGEPGPRKFVGDRNGLVQNIMEDLEFWIVDQEEAHGGFVEDRTDVALVWTEHAGGRHDTREIVEFENDALAAERQPIHQAVELLHAKSRRAVEHDVIKLLGAVPVGRLDLIGEMDPAAIARLVLQPDVAHVAHAAMIEAEIVIVLGRVDLHAVRKGIEHESKHRPRIGDLQAVSAVHILNHGFVGEEARKGRAFGGRRRCPRGACGA